MRRKIVNNINYESDEEIKKLYNEFVNYLCKNGEMQSKKHGNWVKLQYTKDLFFELDTWNHAVKLKIGSGEYDYHKGFEGQVVKYIGIDFGEFNCYIGKELLDFYLGAIKAGESK